MGSKGKFGVCRDEGLVTIVGEGELTLFVAPELKSLLAEAVGSGDEISVDLTRALYIDTAILMALVAAGKDLSTAGRKLRVIIADNSHPQYVLKVTRMNAFLDVSVTCGDQTTGQ